MEEIRRARPPFALIAGGRPDQARVLEAEGIATYLHVPSPGLLRRFLKDGARRFVLEGRECGGHVGPRSSFVLWEQAAAVVLEAIEGRASWRPTSCTSCSPAASTTTGRRPRWPRWRRRWPSAGCGWACWSAPAYLFTAEAVATGAIVPGFQEEAIRCATTVLLETGPGS